MKNKYAKILGSGLLLLTASACGDKFLETDIYNGVDSESALNNVNAVGYALNGTYNQLMRYYFAGNYATMIGDIGSDITYWNGEKGHFNTIYQFTYQDTDTYLKYIWNYGYKVVDNSARVIQAVEKLLPEATGNEAAMLNVYEAEARCLRAYANLSMVNVFCHQVKVNGADYSNMPGLVIVDEPIEAYAPVSRSTIGETYNFIISDLQKAIATFSQIGDQGELYYFGEAAANGLLARANMYMENWSSAATAAGNAIAISGIDRLTYSPSGYKSLYNNGYSNNESLFALAIDEITNWSANSCGTLFTTYGYYPSPYLLSLYNADDCRLSIMDFSVDAESNWLDPNYFKGGKFGFYGGTNPANATNYLINAPEMFLIEAESFANLNQIDAAQNALLVVAKRNNEITSASDLPSTADGIMSFIRDERARELFQEGFRLWDLRRWNVQANLYAFGAPEIKWTMSGVNVSDLIFPIPADEINSGFGVTQNEGWSNTRPQ